MKKILAIVIVSMFLLVGIASAEFTTTTCEAKSASQSNTLDEFTVAYVTGHVIMQRPRFFMPIFIVEDNVKVKQIIPHAEDDQIFEAPAGSYVLSGFAIWLHADRFPNSDVWEVGVLMIGSGAVFID